MGKEEYKCSLKQQQQQQKKRQEQNPQTLVGPSPSAHSSCF